MYNIVFVGNSNVGKTTWMNYLCKTKLKVANYLGVSVEASEKTITHKGKMLHFVDLPGLDDLNHASAEEMYAQKYLLNHAIDMLVYVIDVRNIHKSIPLFLQLKKLDIPMVVILNFIEYKKDVSLKTFCQLIKVPCIYGKFENREKTIDFILEVLTHYKNETIDEKTLLQMDFTMSENTEIHSFLLHPVWGSVVFVCFLIVSIYLLFMITNPFASIMEKLIQTIQGYVLTMPLGIFKEGIEIFFFACTTLLSFLPFLSLFYIWMAILEESGYIAYIAYCMHPFLKIFHLSGNSMICFLVGYGCSVPAILSTRTIENEKERKLCAMLLPMVGCSGRIPLYLLFIATFFQGYEALVFLVLYGTSLLVTLLCAIFLSKKQSHRIFLLELPRLQMPKAKIVYAKVKYEIWQFIKKAFQILWIGSVLLWMIMAFFKVDFVYSIFSTLPFLRTKEVVQSLPFAFFSKENVVAYFSMMAKGNIQGYLKSLWDVLPLSALCYLLYISLNIPCVFTLATLKKEIGLKGMFQTLILMFVLSYLICVLVYYSMYFVFLKI